jgi:hypothetical protein
MKLRQIIHGQVVKNLRSAPALAGITVVDYLDWPAWIKSKPIINVETNRERKLTIGRTTPQFTTDVICEISAAVQCGAKHDAVADLDRLYSQIQTTLINSPELTRLIQCVKSVEFEMTINAESKFHVGYLKSLFTFETYEGPEWFYPTAAVPLTQIIGPVTLTDRPASGLDIAPSSP